ncbi:hypothetical protein BDD14_5263 [Edaphobacter modestus]|uniref:Uncharacterized protein n=1 Tax=Edaphobacter modestus TaxID=388466 RepID=A0A4Q7Z0G0_9BACT|nr:hypothetical protein BDD14_5263 [Edaphobacter modestus]
MMSPKRENPSLSSARPFACAAPIDTHQASRLIANDRSDAWQRTLVSERTFVIGKNKMVKLGNSTQFSNKLSGMVTYDNGSH